LWELLLLVQPDSAEYREQLHETQRRATEVVAARMKAAEKARKAGNREQATLGYLRALSVDPQNAAAAKALRELDIEANKRAYLSKPLRNTMIAARPSDRNGAQNASKPPATAVSELETGVALFKQGDYAASVENLEKFVQSHPRDEHARGYLADAYHELGLASLGAGRKEEALDQLEKARRLGPSDPARLAKAIGAVRRALGEEYYRLGLQAFGSNIDSAIGLWERSLQFDPDHPQAKIRLLQARRAQQTMQSIERKKE
jgi:tetratricopeptide (TPR) repeat protein